jgi:ADP-ribose pyrophosphatase YjhB (NUDIX family)
MALVKHPTASVFLMEGSPVGDEERIGLIYHPRLQKWMIPGGHVEANERIAEAAARDNAT